MQIAIDYNEMGATHFHLWLRNTYRSALSKDACPPISLRNFVPLQVGMYGFPSSTDADILGEAQVREAWKGTSS